ncbi:MAG: heparan-alpha-glucosaminide N-acetyltransferase domain-containing protein [Candidatus Krumholzibacteriales bacterium]
MKGNGTQRIEAIDLFRGFAIAGMILVNTPGSWAKVYPALRHAGWHGLSGADLVFPFFLFISGSSAFFSLRKYNHTLSPELIRKIALRVAVIFAAGIVLNAFPFREPLSELRIMGVLQRIALAWGIAAAMCTLLSRRGLVITSAVILLAYWILLSAGGDLSLRGNLVRAVDLRVLGESHLWMGKGIPFDPEGLLSTLPAAVTVITGYLAGSFMAEGRRVFRGLFLAGMLSAAAGLAWSAVHPVNKYLWTGSYLLLTSGMASVLLAVIYLISEEKRRGRYLFPLKVFGRNPLLLYILSSLWVQTAVYLIRFRDSEGKEITAYSWVYRRIMVPLAGDMFGSLLFALVHLALFWLILYPLCRRKYFLKI